MSVSARTVESSPVFIRRAMDTGLVKEDAVELQGELRTVNSRQPPRRSAADHQDHGECNPREVRSSPQAYRSSSLRPSTVRSVILTAKIFLDLNFQVPHRHLKRGIRRPFQTTPDWEKPQHPANDPPLDYSGRLLTTVTFRLNTW